MKWLAIISILVLGGERATTTRASAQSFTPTIAGYHLGLSREKIGRWVPCEAQLGLSWCHPSDTVALLFEHDTLTEINLDPEDRESHANSHSGAIEQWRVKYYRWARSLFGEPDSVKSNSNLPEHVFAYWNRSKWSAEVEVYVSFVALREYAFTHVRAKLFKPVSFLPKNR
jgi:hypothetical protein